MLIAVCRVIAETVRRAHGASVSAITSALKELVRNVYEGDTDEFVSPAAVWNPAPQTTAGPV
jgi:hypothetical protein